MTRVLLVRHAETDWNREGRVQGWAPTTLSSRGMQQARELATALADPQGPAAGRVDSVVASDLRRARETAREVATVVDCDPTFEVGWRERSYGHLQGLAAGELFERNPELSLRFRGDRAASARPDGGETLLETRRRVLAAWNRLRGKLDRGETAVVVSHGVPILLLLGHVRGGSLSGAVLDHDQENGGVSELRIDSDDVRIVRENWTGYQRQTRESGDGR